MINKKEQRMPFAIGILIGVFATIIFYKVYTPAEPKKKMPAPPKVTARKLAKVAIVLDDFGYNYRNVEAVFNLKKPIEFSILPHLPYSKRISQRVQQKGYEAILHLPLEPYEEDRSIGPESNTITVDMSKQEVLDILNKALESAPFAKGVSNHQGSKATEDRALMRIILSDLKKRNLFFLDSLVTNKSVCEESSRKIGIKFRERDVFLDNDSDFEYIQGQMRQLINIAKETGTAIGIGHDRTTTISALARLMPEAEKEGIEFVFLSELMR